jgi:hypothetical protein
MNLLLPGGAAAAIAALAWQLVPGPRPPEYPVAAAVAEARLSDVDFQGMLKSVPVAMSVSDAEGGRVLRWDFGRPGRLGRASTCTVTLQPVAPERSSAQLECDVHNGDEARAATAARLLKLVMSENVDAALEGREFDHERMGKALLAFAVRNRAALVR